MKASFIVFCFALMTVHFDAQVVINEFNATNSGSPGNNGNDNFVELYNAGPASVDISNWSINDGNIVNIPAATWIAPDQYILISKSTYAASGNDVVFYFNAAHDLNDYTSIILKNASGTVIDQVNFGSMPGVVSSQLVYRSSELINPLLDNNLTASWVTPSYNVYGVYSTKLKQNTMFDPLGMTCENPLACNYNPYIPSNFVHCFYGCFDNNPIPDNDSYTGAIELFDGHHLEQSHYGMYLGVSGGLSTCTEVHSDVWFKMNSANMDYADITLHSNGTTPMHVSVFAQSEFSMHEVLCTPFDGSFLLSLEQFEEFDSGTMFFIAVYLGVEICSDCQEFTIDVSAGRNQCTDIWACNYNAEAVTDDGSCDYASCAGCDDVNAINYQNNVIISSPFLCCYQNMGTMHVTNGQHPEEVLWQLETASGDFVSWNGPGTHEFCLETGCYTMYLIDTGNNGWQGAEYTMTIGNPGYEFSTGTLESGDTAVFSFCITDNMVLPGCTDPNACNYTAGANSNDGSCTFNCPGCTDITAMNYDPNATQNDGSCILLPGSGLSCYSPIQITSSTSFIDMGTLTVPGEPNDNATTDLSCITLSIGQSNVEPRWYSFTPEETMIVYFNGCTDPSEFYTMMVVQSFEGTCDNLICGDAEYYVDQCNYTFFGNHYKMTALAGHEYLIRIYGDQGGAFLHIELDFVPLPPGCMDPLACNYAYWAVEESGNCTYDCLYGCMDEQACNYLWTALYDEGCDYSCYIGCMDPYACNFNPIATTDDGSCLQSCIIACMDPTACNYNPDADVNYLSYCVYTNNCIPGCIFEGACNFNPLADAYDGSCDYSCNSGCTYPMACNYQIDAINEDGSCDYSCWTYGCMDPMACNYNYYSTIDDGSCNYTGDCIMGCTLQDACNYDPNANTNNFSCYFGCEFAGCTDPYACNYDPSALYENYICFYPGCTNPLAYNYNSGAGCDDGSCVLPPPCTGDFNGNGTVDIQDLLDLIGIYGCLNDCSNYDLDSDGIVGASDIVLFMGNMGINCQ